MPLVRSDLLQEASALFWIIVRYGPALTYQIHDAYGYPSEQMQITKQ